MFIIWFATATSLLPLKDDGNKQPLNPIESL